MATPAVGVGGRGDDDARGASSSSASSSANAVSAGRLLPDRRDPGLLDHREHVLDGQHPDDRAGCRDRKRRMPAAGAYSGPMRNGSAAPIQPWIGWASSS